MRGDPPTKDSVSPLARLQRRPSMVNVTRVIAPHHDERRYNRLMAAAFVQTQDASEGGHVRAAIAAKVMDHRRRRIGEEEQLVASSTGGASMVFSSHQDDGGDGGGQEKTLEQRIEDSVRSATKAQGQRRASWVPPPPKKTAAGLFAANAQASLRHAEELDAQAGVKPSACCKKKVPAEPDVVDLYARMPGIFEVHGKDVIFAKRACFMPCLNYNTKLRKDLVWIATWSVFEWFVIIVIVINTLLLAVTDFTVVDPKTLDPVAYGSASTFPYASAYSWQNHMVEILDYGFTAFYVFEMFLKMAAMGVVFGRGAYFSDQWNWVDFVVVVASGLTMIPMLTTLLPSMSVLRVARAVRPIRSVTAIPKLRAVVEAIITSVPGLANVAMVLAGLFLVFGILGLNAYAGKTDFRCRATPFPVQIGHADWGKYNYEAATYAAEGTLGTFLEAVISNRTTYPRCAGSEGEALAVNVATWTKETSPWYEARDCVWPIVPDLNRGCNAYGAEPPSYTAFAFWQDVYRCPNTSSFGQTYCGSNFDDLGNARFVDATHMKSTLWSEDSSWGYTSFNNIFYGVITTFQCITLEGWSDVMWRRVDTTGWHTSAAAFVLLEMIGSYFLMNLVLAVLGDTFDTILEQEELAGVTRKREQVADALRESDEADEEDQAAASQTSEAADAPADTLRRDAAAADGVREAEGGDDAAALAHAMATRAIHHEDSDDAKKDDDDTQGGWLTGDGKKTKVKVKQGFLTNTDLSVIFNEFDVDHDGSLDRDEVIIALDVFLGGKIDLDYLTHVFDNQMDVDGDGEIDFSEFVTWFREHLGSVIDEECARLMVVEKSMPFSTQIDQVAKWWNQPTDRPWCKCKCCCGPCLYSIVTFWVFEQFIIGLILINTVVLALEEYPIDETRVYVLDVVNFVLNYLFLGEMILKLSALGCRIYVKDFFNLFDGIIVVISMVESILAPPNFVVEIFEKMGLVGGAGGAGLSGFSVFRTLRIFRVFRVMKLAQKWKALQNLLLTTVKAIVSSFYFMMLLFTFIFIYGLVGTQLFANKLTFDSLYEKKIDLISLTTSSPPEAGLVTGYRPRSNFDNLFNSLVVVFQVLSGENWNMVFYDCWRSIGSPWIPFAYFASLICIGSFVLLDFFLAILLNDFAAAVKTHTRSVNKANDGPTPKSGAQKAFDACFGTIIVAWTAFLQKRCGYMTKEDLDTRHATAARMQKLLRRHLMQKRARRLVLIATNTQVAATKIATTSRGYIARVAFENLRRAAVFSGELKPRFLKLPPIPLNGSFRQLVPARIRNIANVLLERSFADCCCCVRHFEGKLVRTEMLYAGVKAGTTKARICRIHETVLGEHTFTLEVMSWGQDLARQLAASGSGGSYREPLSYSDVRLMLPPSVTTVEFERLMLLADVDGDGTIDPDELTLALSLVGGALMYDVPQSRVFELTIPQQLFVEFLGICNCDNLVIITIFASAIMLAIDSPLINPSSATILDPLDLVINIIFTFEMILKIVATGFVIHAGSYLRDSWNVLDFTIVLLSWATRVLDLLSSSLPNFAALKVVRILRVFRMLRTINKLPGLKLVVTGILSSIVPLFSTVPVIFFVFLTFAIAFTQSFMGGFSHCTGTVYDSLTEAQQAMVFDPVQYADLTATQISWASGTYTEITSKAVCDWLGADWELILDQSFDHVGKAASALIQMSTTEAWLDIARVAVDSRGIDMQPQQDFAPYRFLYFMLFEAVGAFFLVNLFVGVLIINVAKAKHSAGRKSMLMTDKQLEWYSRREAFEKRLKPLQQLRALRPTIVPAQIALYDFIHARHGPCRAFFLICSFYICVVLSQTSFHTLLRFPFRHAPFAEITFDQVILAVILLNSVMTGATYFGEPVTWTTTLTVVQTGALVIFTCEMVLKMMAYGVCGYLTQRWNIFDGTIVIMSLLGNLSDLVLGAGFGAISNVVRMLRLVRLIRLVKQARGLRVIYETLYAAIPALVNIAFLLAILFFIFAVLGVQLFAKIGFREDGALDEHIHYMDFESAMLNLFVSATGEGWPNVMYALSAGPGEGCVADPPYDPDMCGFSSPQFKENCIPMDGCGVGNLANAYFFTFQVLCTFVMFNLIVFYVLDSFASGNEQEDSLNPSEEELLLNTWLRFDTKCSGLLETSKVAEFFHTLPQPLGFRNSVDENKTRPSCKTIALKIADRVLQMENQWCWWCPAVCQRTLRRMNGAAGKYTLLLAEEMAGDDTADNDGESDEPHQIPLSDVMELVVALRLPVVPIENVVGDVHSLADVAVVASQRKSKFIEMKAHIDEGGNSMDKVLLMRDALLQYTAIFFRFVCCYVCREKYWAVPAELGKLLVVPAEEEGTVAIELPRLNKKTAEEESKAIAEESAASAAAAVEAEALMRSFRQRVRSPGAAASPRPPLPGGPPPPRGPPPRPRNPVAPPQANLVAEASSLMESWFFGKKDGEREEQKDGEREEQ